MNSYNITVKMRDFSRFVIGANVKIDGDHLYHADQRGQILSVPADKKMVYTILWEDGTVDRIHSDFIQII
jgi:hypothetical protein